MDICSYLYIMKIKINNVHGATLKKGLKQNKIYDLISNSGIYTNSKGEVSDLTHFWKAVDEKGKQYTIWDVNRNWTLIGIAKNYRYSYTKDFEIIK